MSKFINKYSQTDKTLSLTVVVSITENIKSKFLD